MPGLRYTFMPLLLAMPMAVVSLAAQADERHPPETLGAPVLNSPWSGIPSFGTAPSPSVLAAVSPPLIGGFLGPSVAGGSTSQAPSYDRQASLSAGLSAMQARSRSNNQGGASRARTSKSR